MTTRAEPITLDDRYLRDKGLVYLSGVQALVRLPLDQNRRDRKAGLRIGTFVSGYPGSPPDLPPYEERLARSLAPLSARGRRAHADLAARCADLDEESRRLVAIRIAELIDYQDVRYAGRYVDALLRGRRPRARGAGHDRRHHACGHPGPPQAHGLQGRVRSGAASPPAVDPAGHAPDLHVADPRHVPLPSADASRPRDGQEARARAVVHAGPPAAARGPAASRHAARPVRARAGPPRGAPAGPVVPGHARAGAGAARAGHRGPGRRGGGAPRGHPRLRGREAQERRRGEGEGRDPPRRVRGRRRRRAS